MNEKGNVANNRDWMKIKFGGSRVATTSNNKQQRAWISVGEIPVGDLSRLAERQRPNVATSHYIYLVLIPLNLCRR